MTLEYFLVRYNISHDIKPSTLDHYGWVIKSLNSYTGRETLTTELCADLLNGYLLWLRNSGRSPFTCKQRRASLLVLWRAAADDGFAPAVPPTSKIRQVRTPDPPKEVWSPGDVAKLIASCDVIAGTFRTLPVDRPDYFRTLIAAAYDSGLRRSDLHAMRAAGIDTRTNITQLKTGRCVVVKFSEHTARQIAAFVSGSGRELIWPRWSEHRGVFSRMFQKIVLSAGLKGSFSKLRKTSGTEVERLAPGSGWVHLGHSSPDTARVWYINQARAYAGNVPLPPEIGFPDVHSIPTDHAN